MRVWLELTQEEGAILFDSVKDFTVERMKTAVVSVPRDNPDEGAVIADKAETSSEEVLTCAEDKLEDKSEDKSKDKPEDKPEVTVEIVRAVLTEKKRSGKDLKVLLSKFGACKLSEIAPSDYAALLKEAETL